jgi:hypothetical protein
MARLILTFGYAIAEPFMRTGVADCVIEFRSHFVWGKLKSSERLKTLLPQRPAKRVFEHWTEGLEGRSLADIETRGLGLTEFCESFDAIELCANPDRHAIATHLAARSSAAACKHHFQIELGTVRH